MHGQSEGPFYQRLSEVSFSSCIWGLSKHPCATSNNDVVVCEFLGTCAARQLPAGGSGWNATNTLLTVLPSQACPSRHRGMSSSVLCWTSSGIGCSMRLHNAQHGTCGRATVM